MRPAATSLFLTAEAVCWELPLGCPWGSPLAHRACWCVAGHISISLPDLLELVCPHLLFQEAVD